MPTEPAMGLEMAMTLSSVDMDATRAQQFLDLSTAQHGAAVGRKFLPAVGSLAHWRPSPTVVGILNALNGRSEECATKRKLIELSMRKTVESTDPVLGHKRPVAAFFTYDPRGDRVILEWGVPGERPMHAYLHDCIFPLTLYRTTGDSNLTIRSGNLAESPDGTTCFASFDDIPEEGVERGSPMAVMINTLHHFGFAPINQDGWFQLPVF